MIVRVGFALGILLLTNTVAEAQKSSARLDDGVSPLRQSIELWLDPDQDRYRGGVAIDLDVSRSVASFRVHSEGLDVRGVRTIQAGQRSEAAFAQEADDVLRVTPVAPLAEGTARVEIEWDAPYDQTAVGLYRVDYQGDGYAFTQFQSDDAREAIPCFDEPGFKIPFTTTIHAPVGDVAITNTPIVSESEAGGWRTTVYAETKPLPTYLLALAVGPFDLVDVPDADVPTRIVTPRGQSELARYAVENVMAYQRAMERWFDSPYPYKKLDHIAVPEFWAGAMEHPGAITYRDTILLVDPAKMTIANERNFGRVASHELAHQWFGNLVTLEWWDDIWLNETFADWLGDKITHEVRPDFDIPGRGLQSVQRIFQRDSRPSAEAIRREIAPGQRLMEGVGVAYLKGKLVVANFERWVGEEAFRAGVIDFIEANQWKNASSADLWSALDRASGRNLSSALASFINKPGYPEITAERLEGGRVRLTQSRFTPRGVDLEPQQWQIPVSLAWGQDGVRQERTVLLTEATQTFDLGGEIDWLYPNAGAVGYCRWALPASDLSALLGTASDRLSGRERIELVGNLRALLGAGRLDGGSYARALAELAQDDDGRVVTAVLTGMRAVYAGLEEQGDGELVAQWARSALRPAWERAGWEPKPGESGAWARVRPELIAALGTWADDAEVQAEAETRAHRYLEDEAAIAPDLASATLRAAAKDGGPGLFDAYLARFESATKPGDRSRWLGTLGAFERPELRERALDYVIRGPLQAQERGVIPLAMLRGAESRDLVLDFVVRNYEELKELVPPPSRAGFAIYGSGCSLERLAVVEEFFAVPGRAVPGTDRSLARVRDAVRECATLWEAEGDAVREELARAIESSRP